MPPMTDIWSTTLDRRLYDATPWAARSSGLPLLTLPLEFSDAVSETVDNFVTNLPTPEQIERAAQLNDEARVGFEDCCTVLVSDAFARLSVTDRQAIRSAVSDYDHWMPQHVADASRDFGVIYQHWDGSWSPIRPYADNMREVVFWTIDCFELNQSRPALRPWDSHTTKRVLTLMLASEN
jgi:hypothetical protein